MAVQPEDKRTPDLFDQNAEDARLREEHSLIPIRAYVRDPTAAKKKSATAERVAKMRERDKEAGLVMTKIPATVAQSIKDAGGDFSVWLEQQRVTAPAPTPTPTPVPEAVAPVERVVEKIVQVPAKLSEEDAKALRIGKRVQDLAGWREAVVSWLL